MRLTKITLGDKQHELSNLVIIIGPNGTGKTTLLADLFTQSLIHTKNSTTSGRTAQWHEAMFRDDFYEISKDEFKEWIENQQIVPGVQQNNQDMYGLKNSRTQANYTIEASRVLECKERIEQQDYNLDNDSYFTEKIKGSYFGYYPVDRRFGVSSEASFAYTDRKAGSYFFHIKELRKAVNKALATYFNKKMFIRNTDNMQYSLVIGSIKIPEPPVHRNDSEGIARMIEEHKVWARDHDVKDLITEGHGVRAFVDIISGIVDPVEKVVFLDEPELHLYPDAKRRLGTDIAKASKKKQIVMVTHDTDIIDGIINQEVPFDVLRIKPDHTIDFVKFDASALASIRSEKKYTPALRAGFYDCAVFVEGVSDRFVYGNIFHDRDFMKDRSYTFISSNGKETIPHHLKFALSIHLPIAIIVDHDALFEKDTLKNILETLIIYPQYAAHKGKIDETLTLLTKVNADTLGVIDRKKGLGGDQSRYGVSTVKDIQKLLTSLQELGVFVVPIGELEDWVGGPNSLSAEEVYGKYHWRPFAKYKDLTDFLEGVSSYLLKAIQQ